MANNIMLGFPRRLTNVVINYVQRRHMPVNVPPTATGKRRFRLAVETDPHKLVNYCCGLNYHIDEPPIPLKPDDEYPDWLWQLRLGPKPNSWEMEKGTKEYYLRLAEEGAQRNLMLKKYSSRGKKIVGELLLRQSEYLHRLRFAALAHMEDDAGLDIMSSESDWTARDTPKLKVRDYYLPMTDRVLYMDKIDINLSIKNYSMDEESTFKPYPRRKETRKKYLPALQDSRRRHNYSVY